MTPNSEPVGWGAGVTALAMATMPMLTAFGINITQNQSAAVLGFLSALVLFLGLFVRSKVTPTAKAEAAVETALLTPQPNTLTGIERQAAEILAATK